MPVSTSGTLVPTLTGQFSEMIVHLLPPGTGLS